MPRTTILLAQSTTKSAPPFSSNNNNNYKRKKKKNKYEKFSKVNNNDKQQQQHQEGEEKVADLDPFELLVQESKQKLEQLEKEKAKKKEKAQERRDNESGAVKGKLNVKKLRKTKKELSFSFPDNKTIDPYDPNTFGYIEIGTIMGAHGVHGWCKIKSETDFPTERLFTPGVRHIKAANKRSPRRVVLTAGKHFKKQDQEYLIKFDQINDRDQATKLRGSVLYVRKEDKVELNKNNSGGNKNTRQQQREKEKQQLLEEMEQEEQEQQLEEMETTELVQPQQEYLVSDLVGLEVYLVPDYDDDDETDNDVDDDTTTASSTNIENNDSDSSETDILDDCKFVGVVNGVVLGDDMCTIPGLSHDMLEVIIPKGKGMTPSLLKDELVLIPFVPQIVPLVSIADQSIFIDPPDGLLDLTYIREEKVRIKGFLPPAKDE